MRTAPLAALLAALLPFLALGALLAAAPDARADGFLVPLTPDRPVPVARSAYVVRQGDTLWSIARRVSPTGDPRSVVDALSAENGISAGDLEPGQVLVVSAGR